MREFLFANRWSSVDVIAVSLASSLILQGQLLLAVFVLVPLSILSAIFETSAARPCKHDWRAVPDLPGWEACRKCGMTSA